VNVSDVCIIMHMLFALIVRHKNGRMFRLKWLYVQYYIHREASALLVSTGWAISGASRCEASSVMRLHVFVYANVSLQMVFYSDCFSLTIMNDTM